MGRGEEAMSNGYEHSSFCICMFGLFLCMIYEKRPFGREWVGWLRLRFVLMGYGRGRGRESSVPGIWFIVCNPEYEIYNLQYVMWLVLLFLYSVFRFWFSFSLGWTDLDGVG